MHHLLLYYLVKLYFSVYINRFRGEVRLYLHSKNVSGVTWITPTHSHTDNVYHILKMRANYVHFSKFSCLQTTLPSLDHHLLVESVYLDTLVIQKVQHTKDETTSHIASQDQKP